MILLLNKATSLSNDFLGLPKEYTAVIRFGIETDSMDMEGNIMGQTEVNELDMNKLERILKRFTGRIKQLVPMYSAVKHRGRPLYRFARKGIDIKRAPRQIYISEIKVLEKDRDLLTLRVACSSGTYIRSLAHDIGKEYGTGAVLSGLRRTRIGDMEVGAATGISQIRDLSGFKEIPGRLSWLASLYDLLEDKPSISVKEDQVKKIKNGSRLSAGMLDKKADILEIMKRSSKTLPGIITVRSADGKIIAIHRILKGPVMDDTKSLDKAFTKNVVIF